MAKLFVVFAVLAVAVTSGKFFFYLYKYLYKKKQHIYTQGTFAL